jgi:hypothetical protein
MLVVTPVIKTFFVFSLCPSGRAFCLARAMI